jgi:F-type H+-transporting ATPase subunit a
MSSTEPVQHAAEGLTQYAPVLFHIGPVAVTNSMVVAWMVTIGLIVVVRLGTSKMKQVPSGFQNFFEWMVESLFSLLEMFLGEKWTRKTFWFFATIFIYILCCNWIGLIPGFMSFGRGTVDAEGHFRLTHALFRGVNADLNSTASMAIIFFVLWTWWAFEANGFLGFFNHIFGVKGGFKGAMAMVLLPVFIFAGAIEVVSILIRPVSLSFRLYGNIFGGENLLEQMYHMAGYLVPIPFMLLELLVGFVQALVFMLLTTVFTMTICVHEEEEH